MISLAVMQAASGPSSQRTDLVVSEIMYHPASGSDYLEFHNTGPQPLDLSGYRVITESGSFSHAFAPGPNSLLASGTGSASYIAVDGDLSNAGDTIQVLGTLGEVLLEIEYSDDAPWPLEADGAGHSLVLSAPSYGESDPRAWSASVWVGGSKGAAEPAPDTSLTRYLVINEFLANPAAMQVDTIEIFNTGPVAVDLSGCVLTDRDDLTSGSPLTIPTTPAVPSGGYISFHNGTNPSDFSFGLSSGGDKIFLWNPAGGPRRVIDAVEFQDQADGVSSGRSPDGSPGHLPLASQTFGAPNAAPAASSLVINEIMYHPITDDNDHEYIELHNPTAGWVDLASMTIHVGANETVITTASTLVPPGGFAVLANDVTALRAHYTPDLDGAIVISAIPGTLSNQGERIALYDAAGILLDEVTYADGGRWGKWSDGGGSSLELIDPRADNRVGANWGDSNETPKGTWQQFTITGDFLDGYSVKEYVNNQWETRQVRYLELAAMGAGEYLIDDVQVTVGGQNYLSSANSGFETGSHTWKLEGNHDLTSVETAGVNGGLPAHAGVKSLHVRAAGTGHYLNNRLRVACTSDLPETSENVTLTAWVRWLRGSPDLVLRVEGNFLEGAIDLRQSPTASLPQKLGTPGSANSILATGNGAVGPAIYDVSHSPALPANNEPVTVRARVTDPDGVTAASLFYRLDPPSGGWTSVPMVLNGSFREAVIPGQPAGSTVAFIILASDGQSPFSRFPRSEALYPGDTEKRVGLVRFGEPGTGLETEFPQYHFWMTQATRDEWESPVHGGNERPQAHNGFLDVTFVYQRGSETRVIYNAGGRYGSSVAHNYSFITPVPPYGTVPTFTLQFPKDDQFHGRDELNLDYNNSGANHYLREQTMFWIARKMCSFYNHRRYVKLYVNGGLAGLYEQAQQPSGDSADQWVPEDNDGSLHKLEVLWDSVSSAGVSAVDPNSPIDLYVRGSEKNLAHYRWKALKRAVQGSAHDFSDLHRLVDAVDLDPSDPNYNQAVEAEMDTAQAMRAIAFIHIIKAEDTYGYSYNHHNMYIYKPTQSGWQFWPYDLDGVMNPPSTTDLFDFQGTYGISDPFLPTIPTRAPFRRAYLQALEDAVAPDGPLASGLSALQTFMTETSTALENNGYSQSWATKRTTISNFMNDRRTAINGNLLPYAGITFNVTGPAELTSTTASSILVTGTAPLESRMITINGMSYPIQWITETSWSIDVPLIAGINTLAIESWDKSGAPLGSPSILHVTSIQASDLNEEFSLGSNPSADGRWAYGYQTTLGGTFTPVTVQYNGSYADDGTPIPSWQLTASQEPAFYWNPTANTLTAGGGAVFFPPKVVWFYAGQDGTSQNFGVIRHTVPTGEAGFYQIECAIEAVYRNLSVGDSDFYILHNGIMELRRDIEAGGAATMTRILFLNEGDTVDFVIGRGADGSLYASGLKIFARLFPVAEPGSTLQCHDLNGGFSAASNPTPAGWGYGWTTTLGGSYTPVTVQYNGSYADDGTPIPSWQLTAWQEPAFYSNPSSSTVSFGSGAVYMPPYAMWFYAGYNGTPQNYGVIRFTVPTGEAGIYQLGCAVQSVYRNLGIGDTDFHLVHNGAELYGVDIPAGEYDLFTRTLDLQTGDTVDFVIGRGLDNSLYASGLKIFAELCRVQSP